MVKSINLYNSLNIKSKHKRSIILIGNFDGLHMGHRKLFNLAKDFKKKYSINIGVLTFEPMPKMYFNKNIKNFIDSPFFHIGPPRDFDLFKDLKKNKLESIEISDYILCTE